MSDRTPSDVEKSVNEVIGDLGAKRISRTVAEQIRASADTRVKQGERDSSLHRAVKHP